MFQDEVLAISEKVVIRLEDLITWITAEAEWTWGRVAKFEDELKHVEIDPTKLAPPRNPNGTSFIIPDNSLDFSDVEDEKKSIGKLLRIIKKCLVQKVIVVLTNKHTIIVIIYLLD